MLNFNRSSLKYRHGVINILIYYLTYVISIWRVCFFYFWFIIFLFFFFFKVIYFTRELLFTFNLRAIFLETFPRLFDESLYI